MRVPKRFSRRVDLSGVALPWEKAKAMHVQGYRFVGRHSAIKICEWCRKSIRGTGECYKQKFYGINSRRCVQMTPVAFFCDFNCVHCWRSLDFELPPKDFKWDSPEEIFEGCLKEQRRVIQGFKSRKGVDMNKFHEAEMPKHFAISLSGEPTLYPYLPEFIDLLKSKGMTAFLVTNGAHPEMIRKLIGKHEPTNLYVTLPAPDEKMYWKECCPRISDGWKRIHETLSILKEFSCATVVRLTLSRHSNMVHPERYAEIISQYNPRYVECKAYMPVGGARAKMGFKAMPDHEEIMSFAKEIEKNSGYKIVNEKEDSKVVLLERK